MGARQANGIGFHWPVHLPSVPLTSQAIEYKSIGGQCGMVNGSKYEDLSNSHIFIAVAIETGGPWYAQSIELV